jgi:hypothetical protein
MHGVDNIKYVLLFVLPRSECDDRFCDVPLFFAS